ncbi:PREDICTED: protein FAM172A-like [Fulmarus glacialis]|uniref:protein FAM172A-like n=1 Tax=Fulmarus glacialis TaxID=30455 RepID=UPI00051C5B2E|nr:PREDICTED: protein FAM172A-like [Fulmarus glacialis]
MDSQIITKYVYELLQKECHLKKVTLPVDATESEPKSFIFMSEDALTNPDKLLVLIHGNGVVRAGQWARRLIINEDLDSGTQIPYIKRATEEGYGVIVLNPNENYIEVEKTKAQVQLSSDSSDEPAEKRERKDKIQKETKKRRDFYEKYRNPQKEKETMHMYIRKYLATEYGKQKDAHTYSKSPTGHCFFSRLLFTRDAILPTSQTRLLQGGDQACLKVHQKLMDDVAVLSRKAFGQHAGPGSPRGKRAFF